MISLKHNFLFIHAPRTSGNSIARALIDYSDDEIVTLGKAHDGINQFGVYNSQFDTTKHSTLHHYKSVLSYNIYNSLFKFAVMRNPWDRAISYYFRYMDVWNREIFIEQLRNLIPMRFYVCEEVRRNSTLDKNIQYILRFEHLQDDFNNCCDWLELPRLKLPKLNSSKHEHYSEYYDDETKDIVFEKFREDIEFGGYWFEEI